MNDPGSQIVEAALARRAAAGLSVRVGDHIRHCTDEQDRDAYIQRCATRGEAPVIIMPPGITAILAGGQAWRMPYTFTTDAERDAFLERLRAENPARQFQAS